MSIRGSGAAWISGHLCCLGAGSGGGSATHDSSGRVLSSAQSSIPSCRLGDHWSSTLSPQSPRGLPCTCTCYFGSFCTGLGQDSTRFPQGPEGCWSLGSKAPPGRHYGSTATLEEASYSVTCLCHSTAMPTN